MIPTIYCRLIARWRHVDPRSAGLLLSDPRVAAQLVIRLYLRTTKYVDYTNFMLNDFPNSMYANIALVFRLRVTIMFMYCIYVSVDKAQPLQQCGDKKSFYDPKKMICCVKEVYKRATGYEACCGWKVYNAVTERCCQKMVTDMDFKCNNRTLLTREHMCPSGFMENPVYE